MGLLLQHQPVGVAERVVAGSDDLFAGLQAVEDFVVRRVLAAEADEAFLGDVAFEDVDPVAARGLVEAAARDEHGAGRVARGALVPALTGGLRGAYNVVAPREHATYGELIATCVEVTGGVAEPMWVDAPWLVERGLKEWTQLVLWRTPAGTWDVDGRRAQAAGLVCRPLAKTVRDTWAWLGHERPVVHERSSEHGIPPDVERALLDEWELLLGRRG